MCKGVLKKCANLHKKHEKQGLVILGLHLHKGSIHEVDAYALRAGLRFPMASDAQNSYAVPSVPWLYLVHPDGKIIWEGKDMEGGFSKHLSRALRETDLEGEESLPKSLAALKKMVKKRQFAKVIEKIVDFLADPEADGEEKKAAAEFKKRLETQADREFLHATSAIRQGDPAKGVPKLERLIREFKGHPLGRRAEIRLKEIKQDPALKSLLKAADLYKKFRAAVGQGQDRVAGARAVQLIRQFKDTLYASRAQKLLEAMAKLD
jgi:hypothetical protein